MAAFNEVQRKWVDRFLGQTGRGADGAVTSGLAEAPLAAPLGQGDSPNGSPGSADSDAVNLTSGQVSADSSMPDEPQGKVRPILVAMEPPPGVNLPTLHEGVELASGDDRPTKQVSRSEVLKRPDYVDNFTKATLYVPTIWDMKNANVLKLNLFYSSSSPVGLEWPLLLFQWEQPAYKYGPQRGKIIPYDPSGNALFDKNNTPSLILAAMFFKEELDKLAAKYEEIADVTYTLSGPASGGGGMRVGNFSGGRYRNTSRSGSKGSGTTPKPPGGSGTGQPGTTPKPTTGGTPKGGSGSPTSGANVAQKGGGGGGGGAGSPAGKKGGSGDAGKKDVKKPTGGEASHVTPMVGGGKDPKKGGAPGKGGSPPKSGDPSKGSTPPPSSTPPPKPPSPPPTTGAPGGGSLKSTKSQTLSVPPGTPDKARVQELGKNHEGNVKVTDHAEGTGGARYEKASKKTLTRGKVKGEDFIDSDGVSISLKGPLVNKKTGAPLKISDKMADGLAKSVAKDLTQNSASKRVVVDTAGLSAPQRAALPKQIDAHVEATLKKPDFVNRGITKVTKDVVFLD